MIILVYPCVYDNKTRNRRPLFMVTKALIATLPTFI